MTPITQSALRRLLGALVLAALCVNVHAQSGNAVSRIIVPFAPGGAREMPARAIQNELNKALGQNYIIDNKPGAGGAIGTAFVAQSAPDGKTLLMAASSHFVTAAMGAKPFFEPIKDFVPVANIGKQSYVLFVNATLPVKNLAEFIGYAKSHPGELNYNSAGIASSTHLAMAYLLRSAGIDMVHIPFKGTAEAANDVSGNRGHAVIMPTAGVGPYLQDVRLRVIGITSAKRSVLLPQLPTLAEGGLPGYFFESWFGLLAPKGTPPATVERINHAVNQVVAQPEVAERLHKLGIETADLNVEGFNKLFLADRDLMVRIVKESGITRD
jgi:tripartite-type tricarboxylate transporter receptor subunit TctC